MKRKLNKTSNEQGDLQLLPNEQLEFTCSEMVSTKYEFHLDQDILEPSYYRPLITVLNNASENDMVVLNINSGGGMLDSAISVIEALKNTRAQTLACLVGSCYSAATLIALCCDNIDVGEFATLMCHNSSYGLGGYTTDIKDRANFEHKMIAKIYHSVYKDFLVKEEIEYVLDNKTIWMDADEIIQRLEVMGELQMKEFEDSQTPDNEKEDASPVKKKLLS